MHESRTGWTFKKPTENGWYFYREANGHTCLFNVQHVEGYGWLFELGGLLHPVRALSGSWQRVTMSDNQEEG